MNRHVICLLVFIIAISVIPAGCFWGKSSRESVSDLFLDYFEIGSYEDMYFLLSPESMKKITKEEFISRYTAVTDALGIKSIRTTRYPVQYGHIVSTRPFRAVFDTEKCGVLAFDYAMDIKMSNEEWTIDWNPSLIFPCMEWGDKVYLSVINPVRGEIFDAESNVLAGNQPGYTAYALLSAFDDVDGFAAEASEVLGMTPDEIKEAIDVARSRGEQIAILKQYLPFSLTREQRDKIISVDGMGLDNKNLSSFRYYPLAQKGAHLIGYVGSITQDDLDSGALEGYDQTGPIGRSGLEQAYDLQLRGKPGLELYVLTSEGKRKKTLYRKEPENGKDLVLSIDTDLQIRVAELMETHFSGISGSVVVSDPESGEIKAAASWPNFDPNLFNFPISPEQWAWLNSPEAKNPLFNRFLQALLPPGSTFKPFTALMGLGAGVVTPQTVFPHDIFDDVWYPNPNSTSWGIRRQHFASATGPLNLRRAIMWSDNIYFAWIATKLDNQTFTDYAKLFAMDEAIAFDLNVARPQISNTGSIDSLALLADSAYGQGELLITPLQLASMYGIFANGNMMKPYVVKSINDTVDGRHVPVSTRSAEIWKTSPIDRDNIDIVRDIMVSTVAEATAHSAYVPGMKIAGKTGTAQMGSSDRAIGWYVGYVLEGGRKYVVTVCADGPTEDVSAKFPVAKGIFEFLKYNDTEEE